MKLPEKRILIPYLSIFILVVLASGLYFFINRNVPPSVQSPDSSGERSFEEGVISETELKKLREELQKFSGEVPKISNLACLTLPIINPRRGAWQVKNEGASVYRFHYRGEVLNINSVNVGDCDYYQITLKVKNTDPDVVLYLPEGLRGSGIFSSTDGQFLAEKKNQQIELKIIYRITDPKWSSLKVGPQVVKWELSE